MNDISQRFADIQGTMPQLWQRLQDPKEPRLVLAVPSLSLDLEGLTLPGGLLHYEERMLYLFHLLSQPHTYLWLFTSLLLPEPEIDYYLHFLRHVPFSHARRRLHLQPLMDRQIKPLTAKILERPALLERLKRAVAQGPRSAYLSVYRSTELEMRLAVELGIPLLGTDPLHERLDSKEQARSLFTALNLEVARGVVGLSDLNDLAGALLQLQAEGRLSPAQPRVVVKQNQGLSGLGNRTLSVMPFWNLLASDLEPGEKQARLADSLRRHWSDAEGREFLTRFERLGGLVECWTEGQPVSVQVHILPAGEPILSGVCVELPDARGRFVAARFPAPDGLAATVLPAARKVMAELQQRGLAGRFEIDFLVSDGHPVAVDINFRKSNSAVALRRLELLAGGGYRPDENVYRDGSGRELSMYTSDSLPLGPQADSLHDVIDISTESGLHFSGASHTGVIFHMLGGVSATRRVGVTCVEHSAAGAEELYARCAEALGPAGA